MLFGKIPWTYKGYVLHNFNGPFRYIKAFMNVCNTGVLEYLPW